jgi:hypothetical protein
MKLDLNALDPLPKLGARVTTEVVYYHSEEKEVKPNLYEKDGKLRYAPPLEWTEKDLMDALQACWDEAAPEEFMVTHMHVSEAAWKALGAVEEEKQDNKPLPWVVPSTGRVLEADSEGWYPHTPGDPAPYSGLVIAKYRVGYQSPMGRSASGLTWSKWPAGNEGNEIIAWKPAA